VEIAAAGPYARHGFALVDEAPLVSSRLMIRMERVLAM